MDRSSVCIGDGNHTPAWLQEIPEKVADEIFSLTGDFVRDQRKHKVDLLIGAYRTDSGLPWQLPSVAEAERRLQVAEDSAKNEYLPIEGDLEYLRLAQALLLGLEDNSDEFQRFTSVQTISGSGAIHIGAAFLSCFLKPRRVWVSDPTWGPHILMFERVGVAVETYPYYNNQTKLLDFQGMIEKLESSAQARDVVILQACAHNPTGLDLSQDQWRVVAELCVRKELFPFFDNAYQGFASGDPDHDAWPIRYFASQQVDLRFCVAQSFSKSFGLYGQRAGAFHLILKRDEHTLRKSLLSQLRFIIRTEYSTPPRNGSTLVKTVLGDAGLRAQWLKDITAISTRLGTVRSQLHDGLCEDAENDRFSHIIKQKGMFSYTGLSAEQALRLRSEYQIYLSSAGRISMSGRKQHTDSQKCCDPHSELTFVQVNQANMAFCVKAIKAVTRECNHTTSIGMLTDTCIAGLEFRCGRGT